MPIDGCFWGQKFTFMENIGHFVEYISWECVLHWHIDDSSPLETFGRSP